MRIMGLDYGSKTVGVSVSDPLLLTANSVETIWRKDENVLRATFRRIEELIREYEVSEIVVGLPVHLSGEEGERSEKSRAFSETLKKRTGLPVHLLDERLTTAEADEVLRERGIPREKRKEFIDQIAADFILQDWLDNRK